MQLQGPSTSDREDLRSHHLAWQPQNVRLPTEMKTGIANENVMKLNENVKDTEKSIYQVHHDSVRKSSISSFNVDWQFNECLVYSRRVTAKNK